MNKRSGFSLVELMLVLIVLSVIGHYVTSGMAQKQNRMNYDSAVVNDSAAIKVISAAVNRWMLVNVDSLADDGTSEEVPLTSVGFRQYLPSLDYDSDVLPSGIPLRAFVRMTEPFPGADPVEHPLIPRAVLIFDDPNN